MRVVTEKISDKSKHNGNLTFFFWKRMKMVCDSHGVAEKKINDVCFDCA